MVRVNGGERTKRSAELGMTQNPFSVFRTTCRDRGQPKSPPSGEHPRRAPAARRESIHDSR